jgi:murein DD-endopeptidase MepM/ murein hydrolase activator NlpD
LKNALFACLFFINGHAAKGQGNIISLSPPLSKIKLTSFFGYRIHPLTGISKFHYGIDISARQDMVLSILNGKVESVSYISGLGITMKIAHADGLFSIYGHLSRFFLIKGDPVLAGQSIGITGKTGKVTGEHLHFEVIFKGHPINPLHFLKAIATGFNTTQTHQ